METKLQILMEKNWNYHRWKGEYTISVYSRGDYKVSFVKDNAQEYNKASSGDESVSNSIDVATINGNEATTAEFTLLPVHKEQIKKCCFKLRKFGQIKYR